MSREPPGKDAFPISEVDRGDRLRLAVIIVHFRTPLLVIDCVRSLVDQVEQDLAQILVVDNASGDGSAEQIESAIVKNRWTDKVQLVRAQRNSGFSAGNNIGMRAVDADLYLLLNSDTIVRPGAVRELLRAAADYPEAGLISPRLECPDGSPQVSTFRYRTPVGELLEAASTGPLSRLLRRYEVVLPVSEEPVEPEWTSFACVLVRREMIKQIGPMDEGYFMYFEDIDYCRRARQARWGVLHWPTARVVHHQGGSFPVQDALESRRRPPRYYYRARSRYLAKFYGRPGLWLANLMWTFGRAISLSREWLGSKRPHTHEGEWHDIWQNALNPMSVAHRGKVDSD